MQIFRMLRILGCLMHLEFHDQQSSLDIVEHIDDDQEEDDEERHPAGDNLRVDDETDPGHGDEENARNVNLHKT